MTDTDFMRRLGLDPTRRAAIVHADDVGMCHGANVAFLELFRREALTCGSVMTPCPWFPEIAHEAAEDLTLDLGVHLTLTSEWSGYRWGPLTRASASSGLVDDEGYFPKTLAALAARIAPEAAEAEMRAQIERALAFGMDVTHLDTHMGAALLPSLIEIYCRLGSEYDLPVLLPRNSRYYLSVLKHDALGRADYWDEAVGRMVAVGMPLVDDFRMTPGAPAEESDAAYRALLETLPDGTTFVALHPNAPGDIEAIIPPRAHFRTDEHRILGSGQFQEWAEGAGIQLLGMRALRDLMRGFPAGSPRAHNMRL